MRMINADALREELLWCKEQSGAYDDHWKDVIERLDAQPTIGGLISVNECSSCRYWDSKSGLSARMCKQFNGFTTQHEFCSRWKPKEEE